MPGKRNYAFNPEGPHGGGLLAKAAAGKGFKVEPKGRDGFVFISAGGAEVQDPRGDEGHHDHEPGRPSLARTVKH